MTKPALMFDKNAFQGIGWQHHEKIADRYDVVVQPPLRNEIANNYVEGKANKRNVSPAEHVITLIRKFGGRYVFTSPAATLCARELRGEVIRQDGTPYTQDYADAFDQDGNPVGILAREPEGAIPVYERWARRVLAREAPLAPAGAGPTIRFTPEAVLTEAHHLLAQLTGGFSNDELASMCGAILDAPTNAPALIRFIADWSTPEGNKARERLRLDAQEAWDGRGRPPFSAYPYAAHCALIALLYFGGIRAGGKAREDNDRQDLEHLKHLPFVAVFVSDDKLVREIGRHLLRPDQRLITKQELLDSLPPGA
jgi:hypothetical protein